LATKLIKIILNKEFGQIIALDIKIGTNKTKLDSWQAMNILVSFRKPMNKRG